MDGFSRDIRMGAKRQWTALLAKHASSRSKSTPSSWLISTAHPVPYISSLVIPPSALAHVPPQILTSFPPLAISLNAYLRALNRLRSLAPLNALNGIVTAMETDLSKLGQNLLTYAKECEYGDEKELEILSSTGAAYTRVMVPFLKRAVIVGVFGHSWDDKQGIRQIDDSSRIEDTDSLDAVLRSWENWLEDGA